MPRRESEILHDLGVLASGLHDAIVVTDVRFNVRLWNGGAATLFGYKAEDVLGKSLLEALHTRYLDDSQAAVMDVLAERGSWQGRAMQRGSRGAVDVRMHLQTLKKPNGSPWAIVATMHPAIRKLERIAECPRALQSLFAIQESIRSSIQIIHRDDHPISRLLGQSLVSSMTTLAEVCRIPGSHRVVLAHDQQEKLEQMASALVAYPTVEVAGCTCSAIEARNLVRSLEPDTLITSMSLDCGRGIDLVRSVKRDAKDICCVLFDESIDADLEAAAREAGADLTETEDAVLRTFASDRLGHTSMSEQRSHTTDSPSNSHFSQLSTRELEVLVLVARGYTSKEIAATIGLSPATVDTYRSRTMTKLEINSRIELVQLVIDAGLI